MQQEVSYEVQEVTHQCQGHHLLAIDALHGFYKSTFGQVFKGDQDLGVLDFRFGFFFVACYIHLILVCQVGSSSNIEGLALD